MQFIEIEESEVQQFEGLEPSTVLTGGLKVLYI